MSEQVVQLEFDFMDKLREMEEQSQSTALGQNVFPKRLPKITNKSRNSLLGHIDILLKQIKSLPVNGLQPFYMYVFKSYYCDGKSSWDIQRDIAKGVPGINSVSQERIRMLIPLMRDEIFSSKKKHLYAKGIYLADSFIQEVNDHLASTIGDVVDDPHLLKSPRLNAIATILKRKVVKGDTILPWIKNNVIFLDKDIPKRIFCKYYQSLFSLLQHEAKPLGMPEILEKLPRQKYMSTIDTAEVNERLVRLILSHSEVFEKVGDDLYQMHFHLLNVTQAVARIIYEQKDVTNSEMMRIFQERRGVSCCGSMSAVTKNYAWCVPIGKSKWVYREDGVRFAMPPAQIIKNYCFEHVCFTFAEITEYLQSLGIVLKPHSVRCYITKWCRCKKGDSSSFCLSTHISKEDEINWAIKGRVSSRKKNKPWLAPFKNKIRKVLKAHPSHEMSLRDMLHECKFIFVREGIARNNFYKVLPDISFIEVYERDEVKYIKLKDKRSPKA